MPASTSPLAAGQPKLVASTGPLKVGQKGEEGSRQEPQQQGESAAAGAATSRPHTATKSRRSGGRRMAPAVADAVALTVRVDQEEATEIDLFLLGLRQELGRTRLDKAEMIRELLRLAQEDDVTRRKLLKRL